MHHVVLDRAGAHDGNLDNEIVEGARLDPRQHRHLRAGFDLERAERVGLADHRIGARILRGDGGEVEPYIRVFGQQIEGAPHAGQHAERQDIDLHEFEDLDIVLVPFDDLAVIDGRRLDRDQFIEPIAGQHEATRMLREMARCSHELMGKFKGKPQTPVAHIEVEGFSMFLFDALRPAPDL